MDLRFQQYPFGLLPHEYIQLINSEIKMPGISKVFKLAEDFPLLNYFNKNNEPILNVHQRVLLFEPRYKYTNKTDPLMWLYCMSKKKGTPNDLLMNENDFNNIRYTYVANMFQ